MGEVDARLAPQLCQLLSADQKEKSARKSESSKQITNKKVKVRYELDVGPLGDVDVACTSRWTQR